jgi:hypothetical protein
MWNRYAPAAWPRKLSLLPCRNCFNVIGGRPRSFANADAFREGFLESQKLRTVYFLAAFLISEMALSASASCSKPITAEYFLPIT